MDSLSWLSWQTASRHAVERALHAIDAADARAACDALADAMRAIEAHRGPTLEVSADGRGFVIDGRTHSLQRQGPLRLMLVALAEHAIAQPNRALTRDELRERAWPGEKMNEESGATRVYTSVRRLRRLGLGALLVTRDDGYLIDPRAHVRIAR